MLPDPPSASRLRRSRAPPTYIILATALFNGDLIDVSMVENSEVYRFL